MIQIYTTQSCSSCRKAKKWFDNHKIDYREKNIFSIKLTKEDIMMMLRNTLNGFEDIISTRSKIFQASNLDIEEMSISDLSAFIIENPSVLRRPIIIEDDKLQVGYNEEEIRMFFPRRLRQIIMYTVCDEGEECVYRNALDTYFKELNQLQQRS